MKIIREYVTIEENVLVDKIKIEIRNGRIEVFPNGAILFFKTGEDKGRYIRSGVEKVESAEVTVGPNREI